MRKLISNRYVIQMVDYLELAVRRLRWLERAWLFVMTMGTVIVLETGRLGSLETQSLINYPNSIIAVLTVGFFAPPYLIGKILPFWNLISPVQGRQTIWETEFVAFIVTILVLSFASSSFFNHLEYRHAISAVMLPAIICSPLLVLIAKYRWKVHLMETPRAKGYVNPQTKLELDEYQKRFRNNISAYILSGIAGSMVQLLAISICVLLMDKGEVFSFFSSLIIISVIINLTIPPFLIKVYNLHFQSLNLRPSSQYFLGATLLSIAPIIIPKFIFLIKSCATGAPLALAIQSTDWTLFAAASTYVIGFLIGALVFDKRHSTRPKSLDFI